MGRQEGSTKKPAGFLWDRLQLGNPCWLLSFRYLRGLGLHETKWSHINWKTESCCV